MQSYRVFSLGILFLASCGGTTQSTIRIPSSKPQTVAILTLTRVDQARVPGDQRTGLKAFRAELQVDHNGAVVFSTGPEDIGPHQNSDALDVVWSATGNKLAYRNMNHLRLIALDGNHSSHNIGDAGRLMSSCKWLNDDELLIVTKRVKPFEVQGRPIYKGYITTAEDVQVLRLGNDGTLETRYTCPVDKPTFLFHSVAFKVDEISPYSDQVAFSDGRNICVYDDSSQKCILKTPVEGSVEGIWWIDKNTLLLGLGLLSSTERRFATVEIANGTLEDVTPKLRDHWKLHANFQDAQWFRAALRNAAQQEATPVQRK